jgi:hypothetical protein
LTQYWVRFRQWTFPEEFRLPPVAEVPELDTLRILLASLPPPSEAVPAALSSPPEPSTLPATPVPSPSLSRHDGFMIELCNTQFRLRRNAREMAQKSPSSVEATRIAKAVENLDQLLAEHQIECLDLEGKPYDDGRRDFEPLSVEPGPASVVRPTIGRCERPLIRRNGALVQKGRGIVLQPAGLATAGV